MPPGVSVLRGRSPRLLAGLVVVALAVPACVSSAAEPAAERSTVGTSDGAGALPPTTAPPRAATSVPPPSPAPAPEALDAPAPPPAAVTAPRSEGLRRLSALGIPDLAARAYLNASQRAPEALPGCRVPPELLAAVGAAESRHGEVGSFDEDGTSREVIRGYATTGPDTDAGRLDGDPEADWAVGPMQFTPETWVDLGRDGDDDGDLDPSNFYDAALATAAYLCHFAGPFPDATFIAAQWDQWDRQVAWLKQRTEQLHQQWERQKDYRERLEQYVNDYPGDPAGVQQLARTPALGPEPTYVEPAQLAGPAQVVRAVEGYYGPEGETRDDYSADVVRAFRRYVAGTGGAPVTLDDRRA